MHVQASTLHKMLGELRASYGLSYQQLSARSYVDVAYLHRLETGRATRPSRDVLIRIAFGLGLDLETADDLILAAGHFPLLSINSIGAAKDQTRRMTHTTP